MKSTSVFLLIALAIACSLLVGCSLPSVRMTPQPTEIATAEARTFAPSTAETPVATLSEPQPTETLAISLVSIREVMENPDAFRDHLVRMQGHGLIAATLPLCSGYTGLDRRTNFVDATGAKMVADVKWQPAPDTRMYDPDNLRTFEGYIRIFSGEIGCPGEAKVETFPYFEVVGMVE